MIRFLWSKGRTPIEIQRGMQPTYGERCFALRSVKWWCSEFETGPENFNDNERAGRPRVSVTDHKTARVGAMVKTDRRVRIKDIAQELDISFGSAFTSAVLCEKEIPYCAICSQSDVNGILGLPWTARAGFHATRFHNECRQILFHTVTSAGCDQKEAPQDSRC